MSKNNYFFHIGFPKTASTYLHQVFVKTKYVDSLYSKDLDFFTRKKSFLKKEAYESEFKNKDLDKKIDFDHSLIMDIDGIKLLNTFFPDSKVLVTIRNPIEYTKSNFLYQVSQGRYAFTKHDFDLFFDQMKHEILQSDRLKELFSIIDQKRILILDYELLVTDKKRFLNQIEIFMGLKDETLQDIGTINPARKGRYPKLIMFYLRKINTFFRHYFPMIHTRVKNNFFIKSIIFKEVRKEKYNFDKIFDEHTTNILENDYLELKYIKDKYNY